MDLQLDSSARGSTIRNEIGQLGAASNDDTPSVDPEMVKVFDEAAKYMEDTWKKAGSPTKWPVEKWDGLTDGALSRMLRLVELARRSGPALVEKVSPLSAGDKADKSDNNVPRGVNAQAIPYDYLFNVRNRHI